METCYFCDKAARKDGSGVCQKCSDAEDAARMEDGMAQDDAYEPFTYEGEFDEVDVSRFSTYREAHADMYGYDAY